MRYKIVKNVHLDRDPVLTNRGYDLGVRDSLSDSRQLIISDMITDKSKFINYTIGNEDDIIVKTYTKLSQVVKDIIGKVS